MGLMTSQHDYTILNCTIFCEGIVTWCRGCQKSTIDYMLCSKNIIDYVDKFIIDEDRNFGTGSDHNSLLLELKIEHDKSLNENRKNITKDNLWNIRTFHDYSAYQQKLENGFANWDIDKFDDVDKLWDSWKTIVVSAAKEGIGTKTIKKKKKHWLDKEVKSAILERREAARAHRHSAKINRNHNITGPLWEIYQEKRLYVKRLIAKKITESRVNKSVDIARKGGPSCKDFWDILKNTNDKHSKSDITCIKSPESGEIITDKDKIMDSAKKYWESLGESNSDKDCFSFLINREVNGLYNKSFIIENNDDENILTDIKIDLEIIHDALSIAKNNKAPGADNITNELLKNGGNAMETSLVQLFNKLLQIEKIPDEWNLSIIVPIFKKGDRNNFNNYRGISLTSCVSKIFNRVISMHISYFVENEDLLSEVQGGFRSQHRCEDHIFSLKSILTCRSKEGKNTYLAFLDFRKAFDSVWREGILKAAWDAGIRGKVQRIVKCLYDNVKAKVRIGNDLTDQFNVDKGVNRGVSCPLYYFVFL